MRPVGSRLPVPVEDRFEIGRVLDDMDPDLLEKVLIHRASIGRLPTAAVVVDMCGQSADYDRILPLLEQYNIPVVEDAAELPYDKDILR